ncbi:hypothetical protein [Plantactinospora soyae]|uniref:Uncharacterized protein n=1 Tax=Plantactinospora soyae TaxID=1544732 RepID=A0A927LYC9_9ACTN|nr:hypothetical protein [Plantactinospora soyae]MBE1484659.1 hypothetical protein [Plantactinospora soyae]
MSAPLELRAFLVHCMDDDDEVRFTFVDGRTFLGRVLDVTDERVLMGWRFSPISAQWVEDWTPEQDEEWVPFEAVRPDTLARYDTSAEQWVAHTA